MSRRQQRTSRASRVVFWTCAIALLTIALTFRVLAERAYEERPAFRGLQSFDRELGRLKTDTALLAPMDCRDSEFRWSPLSEALAIKRNGQWYRIDLSRMRLEATTWRHEKLPIGVLDSQESVTKIEEGQVANWEKVGTRGARSVTTRTGVKIELPQEEMSTSLVVTRPGRKAQLVWTTGLENCHTLVLSADEKYVAFISEMNGVVVMKIPGT